MSRHGADADAVNERLLHGSSGGDGAAAALFNHDKRPYRDYKFTVAFLVTLAIVASGGIVLFLYGDPNFVSKVSPDSLADPLSCPVDGSLSLRSHGGHEDNVNFKSMLSHPLGSVMATLGGSILVGAVFLLGFRHSSSWMVNSAIAMEFIVPVGLAIVSATQQNWVIFGMMCTYTALLAYLFYLWREQIGVVCRLLGVASHALIENPGLVVLSLVMPIVGSILLLPSVLFAYGAFSYGSLVPNTDRFGPPQTDPDGHLFCVDEEGASVTCCSWEIQPAAQAYLGLLGVAVTWSSMLLSQIKYFTIAGAVAQWYFQTSPAAHHAPSGRRITTRSRTLVSLGHALGPSFGSLCAGALLLTVIDYLRKLLDAAERQAREEGWAQLFAGILVFILRLVLSAIEFLTRFTTVRMAITGESFVTAGHNATDLIMRNALDAFGVWWLPSLILQNCAFVISLLFGVVNWQVLSLVWSPSPHDMSSAVLGLVSGALALLIMSFFSGILLNVVDSVFVCVALDRDAARMTRPEIHHMMQDAPGLKGQLVEQPDGDLAYAAPPLVTPSYA